MATCVIWSEKPEPVPLRSTLKREIEYLITTNQADRFLVRNEGLFDAMIHFILIDLKMLYPHISFYVVPSHMPSAVLPKKDLEELYIPKCIKETSIANKDLRDRWMLSVADMILLYGQLNVQIKDGIKVVRIHNPADQQLQTV